MLTLTAAAQVRRHPWVVWLSIVLTLALMLLLPLQATASAAPATAAARTPPVPLLWKVSDGNADLYLLGSFHLLRADDYPLALVLEQTFAQSRRVVFELAPEELNSPQLAQRLWQAGRRGDGSSLRQDLDAQQWRRLLAYCQRRGLVVSQLQQQRPWLAALSIGLAAMVGQGLEPALGLDRQLIARAAGSGKTASGLETAQEQIALFTAMPLALQRQMLIEALDDADGGDSEMLRLHAAWRRGDAVQLWAELGQSMRLRHPALYQRVNVERNQRWLPRLQQLLRTAPRQGTAMVVVGTLHLIGEDGLIEGLRARGYRVERLGLAVP